MTARSKSKDVAPSKVRARPEPNERQRKAIKAAVEFCRAKPEPYRTEVDATSPGKMMVSPPHSDTGGYLVMRARTFGTSSLEFAEGCEGWLAQIVTRNNAQGPRQTDLNAVLAAVGGVEPRDEIEGMLAVQMAATFETAMSMLSTAKHADMVEHSEKYGNLAVKMMRTYTTQVEALAKLRRGGEQTVRVEHVHVYPGGQAIVGNVSHQPGAPGGIIENRSQPHAPGLTGSAALAFQADPTMLCPDTGRDAMPIASGAGEDTVPDARRQRRKRGTPR